MPIKDYCSKIIDIKELITDICIKTKKILYNSFVIFVQINKLNFNLNFINNDLLFNITLGKFIKYNLFK